MMREDRDKFVKILEENLTPNSKKNFDKKFGDEYNSHNTPFDYKSVMMPLDWDNSTKFSMSHQMVHSQKIYSAQTTKFRDESCEVEG